MELELNYILMIITGVFWGGSNFMVERTTFIENNKNEKSIIVKYFNLAINNWKFLICYLFGQIGSVVFYYCLGKNELSVVVFISNLVSILIGFTLEILFSKRNFKINQIFFLTLILIGVYLLV